MGKERAPKGLTPRRIEYLEKMGEGLTNAQIGNELGVAFNTVGNMNKDIYSVLGANGKMDAVVKGIDQGIIDLKKVLNGVDPQRVSLLSPRQYETFGFAAQGLTHQEVAEKLGISVETIKHHLNACYEKLKVNGIVQAAVVFQFTRENGILPGKQREAIDKDSKKPVEKTRCTLTANEIRILKLKASGYRGKEIADKMGKARDTIKNTLSKIYQKMDTQNGTQTVVVCIRDGILDLNDLSSSYNVENVRTLSFREQEIVGMLATGGSNCEIARELGISVQTVKNHTCNIYRKLDVDCEIQAVVMWLAAKKRELITA